VLPTEVDLHVEVDPARGNTFRGEVSIRVRLARSKRALRLHAKDLRVTRPRVEGPGGTQRGQLRWLPDLEMLEIRFDEPLRAGEARLQLAFAGRLRRDLCGLYGTSVGKRRYAFTQLEATDARKFFPCFDEPAMKARFRLSVTTGAKNAVLSNTPVARTRKTARGRKTVEFQRTPPLSTYLLALAVGELERSRPLRLGPTEIRVWHTPGKKRLTAFGLEAARECLARLERYFDLPYPYAKLDLVAVPDFEFGAMENAGAVFFRETLLLLDPTTATLSEKKRAAEVIAHELAHMWYGDLVTMVWWDDLWLNEAFATWMAFAVVDDWKPDWHMWHDFQHGRAAALELDALRHTHPIYCEVRTAAEANENFDLITYEKGAAVVRMIERYLGTADFRRGVRRYIRRHREGNTVAADLWRALSEASGEPVERLARAWIEQEGYPVLTLQERRADGRGELRVSQERFFGSARRRPSSGSVRWPVPWVARVMGPRTGRGRLERRLLTRAHERVDLGRGAPCGVYGNADEGGFFRPLHGSQAFGKLLGCLGSLSAVERMGLVDHQWALARAARAPIASFLDLAAAFRGFVEARFGTAFETLGWDPAPGEEDALRMRRAALLGIAGGVAASQPVLEEAARRCARYLADRRSIDANLADSVVGLAARRGGAGRHRQFLAASKSASTPQEQRRFLLALGAFREPRLVERTLALSLTPAVATQDVIFLLARLLANPAAREATWAFVQARWTRLEKRMPALLASRLVEATWLLLTPSHRRQVARFFTEHRVPSGARALRQTLERFDGYRSFRREAARGLERWLADGGRPPNR
jgi:puromycin-sensitive aminopeptidase